MIKKFQHKLLIAFGLLIVIIITSVLTTVNSTIDSVSEIRIVSDLRLAQKVFEDFAKSKRKSKSESAASLINSQPILRAVLANSTKSSDDLFGDTQNVTAETFEEINAQLYSTVESLDLYQDSQIFAITDENANLLFTKTEIKHAGSKLANLGVIKAALRGNEVATHWGSEDAEIKNYKLLPQVEFPTLFEVFVKPIIFGTEVKGLMIVGFSISKTDLAEIENVTRAKIAFLQNETLYGSTENVSLSEAQSMPLQKTAINEFSSKGEIFIRLFSQEEDGVSENKFATIIYRAKSAELNFYSVLKNNLNLIGVLAVLTALLFSALISGSVTRSIRELIKGVNEVRAGNLDYEVQVKGQDELAQLAGNFNLMTQSLKEKEYIKSTFKKYVNPRIVNLLLEDKNNLKLGGDKKNIIIYFADIVGFTTISEKLSPEITIQILNNYLSQVASLIENSEGIIDKYIGDAVMAYWLPVNPEKNYEKLICEVALRHRKIVTKIKAELLALHGIDSFDVRIGIHKGEVIMGNIGSDERMDYTIIGDNVNLASRLESLNKQYGTHILLSEDVAKNLQQDFLLREIDLVKVVGKSNAINIYEILAIATEANEYTHIDLARFAEGLRLYRVGSFTEALEIFESLLAQDLVALKFAERCKKLIINPPTTWDGSFQAIEK